MKIFAALLLMIGISSASWAMDPLEKKIQGTWDYSQGGGGGLGMSLHYTFHRGTYELKGYPPLHQTGRYRVLQRKGDTLELLFFDKKGDLPPEDQKISITIGKDGQTLMIDQRGPWSKTQ